MKQILFYSLLAAASLFVFQACGNSPKDGDLRAQIYNLEAAVKHKADEDGRVRSLMTMYVDYIQHFPQDSMSPVYMYRMAEVYYRAANWGESAKHLRMLLEKYPASPVAEEAYIFSGMVYDEKLLDSTLARKAYQSYLEKYPSGKYRPQAELFFKSPQEKLLFRIKTLEENLNKGSKKNEQKQATLLMAVYRNYAQQFPEDSISADFCMKGAKLASGVGESFVALELYSILREKHPQHPDAPYAVFLSATELDGNAPKRHQRHLQQRDPFAGYAAQFRDYTKADFLKAAEKTYKEFLSQYPTHPLAKDVQLLIKNLGKSDNDVVKAMVEKNKSGGQ